MNDKQKRTTYNWCIPMKREKLRGILADELYGERVLSQWVKLADGYRLIRIHDKYDVSFQEQALDMYIRDYYPGKYLPYIDKE